MHGCCARIKVADDESSIIGRLDAYVCLELVLLLLSEVDAASRSVGQVGADYGYAAVLVCGFGLDDG